MLWLGIHLPWLPLAVFERGNGADEPVAVINARQIIQANTAAIRGGVSAGMRLAGAQAVLPGLRVRERDPDAEAALLEQLSSWALQFSNDISPVPPNGLLVEIGGSLRYFRGLERLRGRIQHALASLGHGARLGIAPTPTAARLRAMAGHERPVLTPAELEEAMPELPVSVLSLTRAQHEALSALGIETLGDCLALPRDGLARRFGTELVDELDRALGRIPDPSPRWQPPVYYTERLELPAEVTNTDHLVFAFSRLISGLCGFLRGRESATQKLAFRLEHHDQAPTPFTLGLVTPSRDADHLFDLLRHRLERIRLPAAVTAIELDCRDIQSLPPAERALFDGPGDQTDRSDDGLINRLVARLGEQRIQGLGAHPEHRPERAWCYQEPGTTSTAIATAPRPLWLLDEPIQLALQDGHPAWHGPLTLQQGPERIESGWWDGGDIARDYYLAVNPIAEQLWIYRDRRTRYDWYLHGLFG